MLQFTTRTLLGRGTTFNFDSTGYKFIEVVANIGGYYYSKIFLQQELIHASPNIIVNIRYDVNNYFSGYYNINSYYFSGINPAEQAGLIYIVDDIAVYGIK